MNSPTVSPISDLEVLNGLQIIDCDSHFTEPPDLWTSRVAKSQKEDVPMQRIVDGKSYWFLGDEVWASIGGNNIKAGGEKVLGTHQIQPFDNVDRAVWSVKERLALMDGIGIHAQVLYPNGIGFASNHIFAIEDHQLRSSILRTYNDFLMEVQQQSGERLFPQALLPIWDMDLTIAEMTRLLDLGMRGFTLSDKPELLGLPELWEPYFAPMWDLMNESGAAANFHIGSGGRREEREAALASVQTDSERIPATSGVASPSWGAFGPQRRLVVLGAQSYMSNVRIIVNLCMSDLFDRYPKLKIVSAESGIGWIPFIKEALEYQFDEMVTESAELQYAERRPTEYFRDHIYVMFWFETLGATRMLEEVGVNNVLVETDIPHPTSLYPHPKQHFAEVLANVDPVARRRVLQDNAAELYHIPI